MWFKKKLPELYTEDEMNAVESHISSHFGEYKSVLHEIVSPDIHVDICMIEPTAERNYHTLVTMGMGAHRMKVPKDLRKSKVDRAEVLITLPPDWKLPIGDLEVSGEGGDEKWYWPLRWLKILARLPGEQDTWLGYGHTVPSGEPFAENTDLCGVLITMPYYFGNEAAVCTFPDGTEINFYQVVPLYDNEMNFKIENGAEALEDLFPDDFDMVVDVDRKNFLW